MLPILLLAASAGPVPTVKGMVRLPGGDLLGIEAKNEGGKRVLFSVRGRFGGHWADGGVVATREPGTDIGDGNLIRLLDGRIWAVYRDNSKGRFAIRTSESRDSGATWSDHSTVATNPIGLWAPTLYRTRDDRILCVYDDENAPTEDHHQWLMGRFWKGKSWSAPFVVSRAPEGQLSRDGMAWLAETTGGKLVCSMEGVSEQAPYSSLLRTVESTDGGRTWGNRRDLFRPKGTHMAVSPSLIRLPNGRLACVFATDEDREVPDKAGTPPHRFNMDIKMVVSADGGLTWSSSQPVFTETHRNYLPSTVIVDGKLLVTWLDFVRGPQGVLLGGNGF